MPWNRCLAGGCDFTYEFGMQWSTHEEAELCLLVGVQVFFGYEHAMSFDVVLCANCNACCSH